MRENPWGAPLRAPSRNKPSNGEKRTVSRRAFIPGYFTQGGTLMKRLEIKAAADSAKKAFTVLDEFKNFAFKGNVIDLAVGVIIGAAFGKIIDSLVKNILMPVLGVILPGDQGYIGWKYLVNGKEILNGLFIGEMVNFIIVAIALFFFIVKFLGWIVKEKTVIAAAVPPPAPTRDQELPGEIRDLLKMQGH
jgi:large conductance mechanosensitive channel